MLTIILKSQCSLEGRRYFAPAACNYVRYLNSTSSDKMLCWYQYGVGKNCSRMNYCDVSVSYQQQHHSIQLQRAHSTDTDSNAMVASIATRWKKERQYQQEHKQKQKQEQKQEQGQQQLPKQKGPRRHMGADRLPDKYEVFRALGLTHFSAEEVSAAFHILHKPSHTYGSNSRGISSNSSSSHGDNGHEQGSIDSDRVHKLFHVLDGDRNAPKEVRLEADRFYRELLQLHGHSDQSSQGQSSQGQSSRDQQGQGHQNPQLRLLDTVDSDARTDYRSGGDERAAISGASTCTAPHTESEATGVPVTFARFRRSLEELATRLDPMVSTVAGSFLLTGASIGVVVPCMPLMVTHLGISPSEFGLIISSFGLAKLLGNIPAAHFVEHVGRKPVIVAGLGLCTLGIGGVGLALVPELGYPWMLGCRLITGLGVSAVTAGSFMLLADVSTTLNRTRTQAPVMASFQGGIALGPALGGVMLDKVGIGPTYFTVGGFFMALTALNHLVLKETKPRVLATLPADLSAVTLPSKNSNATSNATTISTPLQSFEEKSDGIKMHIKGARDDKNTMGSGDIPRRRTTNRAPSPLGAFQAAFSAWRVLLRQDEVRDLALLNGAFMMALAGVQMTMLQLFMIGPSLQLGAADIGYTYAAMSVVSFTLSQPIAWLADKHNKALVSLGGCGLMTLSAALIPLCSTHPQLLGALLPLAMGSTVLNTVPAAHMGNVASLEQRAQALSLLRTSGDLGLLAGGWTAGVLAQLSSVETAIYMNGVMLLGAIAYLGGRQILAAGKGSIPVYPTLQPGLAKRDTVRAESYVAESSGSHTVHCLSENKSTSSGEVAGDPAAAATISSELHSSYGSDTVEHGASPCRNIDGNDNGHGNGSSSSSSSRYCADVDDQMTVADSCATSGLASSARSKDFTINPSREGTKDTSN